MKTRVTFRLASDLAGALREVGNQTQFVEAALRRALGRTCPTCRGSGRIPRAGVQVSNFRTARLPALERTLAQQLRKLVRLAAELGATNVELERATERGALAFAVVREDTVLLCGTLRGSNASLELAEPTLKTRPDDLCNTASVR